jgi:hypothetical protein
LIFVITVSKASTPYGDAAAPVFARLVTSEFAVVEVKVAVLSPVV